MKGRKLLALSLLSLLSFSACSRVISDPIDEPVDGDELQVLPSQDIAVPEEAIVSDKQQPVYQMYKRVNPSYDGDEKQFLEDVVRGQVLKKEAPDEEEAINLNSIYMLDDDAYDVLDKFEASIETISGFRSDIYYQYQLDEPIKVVDEGLEEFTFYNGDVAVYSNELEMKRIGYGYELVTGTRENREIQFMVSDGLQCATYHEQMDATGECAYDMPIYKWDIYNNYFGSPMTTQSFILNGYLLGEIFSSSSFFVYNQQNQLFAVNYYLDPYAGSNTSSSGCHYDYIEKCIYLVIADLNTLEDPKINSIEWLEIDTSDHSGYGQDYGEQRIINIFSQDMEIVYGDTLTQKYLNKDSSDFEELIPPFMAESLQVSYKVSNLDLSGAEPAISSSSYYDLSSQGNGVEYHFIELEDGSTKYTLDYIFAMPANTCISGDEASLHGTRIYWDTDHYETQYPTDKVVVMSGLSFDEGNVQEEQKIFKELTITSNPYIAIKDYSAQNIKLHFEVVISYDNTHTPVYEASIKLINLADQQ